MGSGGGGVTLDSLFGHRGDCARQRCGGISAIRILLVRARGSGGIHTDCRRHWHGFHDMATGSICTGECRGFIYCVAIFGWLWGMAGLLLGAPLLAIVKVVCDRVEPLKPLGELLGR